MANPTKQSTEAAVRDIRRKTRRKFSPEEKIRIVLEGLRGEESVPEAVDIRDKVQALERYLKRRDGAGDAARKALDFR